MNHILGTQVDDDRLVHHHVNLIERLNVVLAVHIGGVHAKDIVRRDEFHVLPAENTVRAGITNVPRILLRHNLNDRGFTGGREFIHRPGPKRHGDADQEHRLDGGDGELNVTGRMIADTVIIGFGIA